MSNSLLYGRVKSSCSSIYWYIDTTPPLLFDPTTYTRPIPQQPRIKVTEFGISSYPSATQLNHIPPIHLVPMTVSECTSLRLSLKLLYISIVGIRATLTTPDPMADYNTSSRFIPQFNTDAFLSYITKEPTWNTTFPTITGPIADYTSLRFIPVGYRDISVITKDVIRNTTYATLTRTATESEKFEVTDAGTVWIGKYTRTAISWETQTEITTCLGTTMHVSLCVKTDILTQNGTPTSSFAVHTIDPPRTVQAYWFGESGQLVPILTPPPTTESVPEPTHKARSSSK
jgi:hypothetical protein